MIDLHCHILPRIDDGPQSMEEALDMARFCVADGITHVVATPHCHRYVHLLKAEILPAVERFNERLRAAQIALTVLPGSEIQVTDSKEFKQEFQEDVFCHLGGGRDFTLVEFNWNRGLFPADAGELIQWICKQDLTPILAHPERHDYLWEDPDLLKVMVAAGAWVQVTVDSLLGNHGMAPSIAAESILEQYQEVVLATDAHNLGRCSGLTAGYQWVSERLGEERSEDLKRRAEAVKSKLLPAAAKQ